MVNRHLSSSYQLLTMTHFQSHRARCHISIVNPLPHTAYILFAEQSFTGGVEFKFVHPSRSRWSVRLKSSWWWLGSAFLPRAESLMIYAYATDNPMMSALTHQPCAEWRKDGMDQDRTGQGYSLCIVIEL